MGVNWDNEEWSLLWKKVEWKRNFLPNFVFYGVTDLPNTSAASESTAPDLDEEEQDLQAIRAK